MEARDKKGPKNVCKECPNTVMGNAKNIHQLLDPSHQRVIGTTGCFLHTSAPQLQALIDRGFTGWLFIWEGRTDTREQDWEKPEVKTRSKEMKWVGVRWRGRKSAK